MPTTLALIGTGTETSLRLATLHALPFEVISFHLDRPFDLTVEAGKWWLCQGKLQRSISDPAVAVLLAPRSFDELRLLPEPSPKLDRATERYHCRQWSTALYALMRATTIRFVGNHPDIAERAANKILADALLRDAGIRIPERRFSAAASVDAPSGMLVKNVSDTNYFDTNRQFTVFEGSGILSNISRVPLLVEERLDAISECRVYDFCGDVRVVSIAFDRSLAPSYKSLAHSEVCFALTDSSDTLVDLSRTIRAALELDYVCFDLIETQQGPYVIDINPHGSWHWLPESLVNTLDASYLAFLTKALQGTTF